MLYAFALPGSLEFVMDLFRELGCRESYWKNGARWAMIEQQGNNTIIQFIETAQPPQATEDKRNSHIAFLSSDPQYDIAALKEWIRNQNKKTNVGSWSDRAGQSHGNFQDE